MTVRLAAASDIPEIMDVLEAARGIMRSDGNLGQWADGYPSESIVRHDIECSFGHVLEEDGKVVGYFAFVPSPEPTYSEIFGGKWLDDDAPYHVIHRIGSFPQVHGVFSAIMKFAFSRDRNIRLDTHRDNRIMQHNILKHSFSYCGIIYLESGDERLAYQRLLP